MPNFPNYRLGKHLSPPCELISDTEEVVEEVVDFRIFPNPARDYVEINSTLFLINLDHTYTVVITDITGKAMITKPIDTNDIVNTNNLHSGIYNVQLYDSSNALVANQKLVIIK